MLAVRSRVPHFLVTQSSTLQTNNHGTPPSRGVRQCCGAFEWPPQRAKRQSTCPVQNAAALAVHRFEQAWRIAARPPKRYKASHASPAC